MIDFSKFLPSLDLSWIGDLPKTYEEGQARYREGQIRQDFQKNGIPVGPDGQPDYAAIMQRMAAAGGIGSMKDLAGAVPFYKLQEERQKELMADKAAADFNRRFGTGGGSSAPDSSYAPNPRPARIVPPGQSGAENMRMPTYYNYNPTSIGSQPGLLGTSTPYPGASVVPVPTQTIRSGQSSGLGSPTMYAGAGGPATLPFSGAGAGTTDGGGSDEDVSTGGGFAPYQVAQAGGFPPPPSQPQTLPIPGLTSPTPLARQGQQNLAAPLPQMTQNPVSQNIPNLVAALSNRRLPEAQRQLGLKMLEHALKESDIAPDMKDYLFYRAQGGTKTKHERDLELKRAGALTVNTAEGLEAAQVKARVAIDQKAIEALADQSAKGHTVLPLLEQVIEISKKTPAGWAGPIYSSLSRAAAGMGLPVPEGWSNTELLASIGRQLIPGVRDPGSTSNLEQQMYGQAVPGLANSVEGRVKLATMFRALQERRADVVRIYRENVGSLDLDRKLRELDAKPLFNNEQRAAIQAANENMDVMPAAAIKELRENRNNPAAVQSAIKHFGRGQVEWLLKD